MQPKQVPKRSVVIIPVKGRFGPQPRDSKELVPVISGRALEEVIERMSDREPLAVVLDLGDLQGGSGKDLTDMLESVVRLQLAGTRLVAWVGELYGPGAEIALACREIITHPDAKLGWQPARRPPRNASTAARAAGEDSDAIPDPLLKAIAECTGRSASLESAMRVPESELWWNASRREFEGFRRDGAEWKQVDGPKTALVFSSKNLAEFGLSKATADTAKALRTALKTAEGSPLPDSTQVVAVFLPNPQMLISYEVERGMASSRGRSEPPPAGERQGSESPKAGGGGESGASVIAQKLGRMAKTVAKHAETLYAIQSRFPGPPPDGDARDPGWTQWALGYRAFSSQRAKATSLVRDSAQALNRGLGGRPEDVEPAAWAKVNQVLRGMSDALSQIAREMDNEQVWMTRGAASGLQGVSECHGVLERMIEALGGTP